MNSTDSRTTRRTSLAEVRDLGTVEVWSDTEPNAAGLMNLGRTSAYARAKDGTLPTIRLGPRRIVVPVPALLRLLGVEA
jgi:hypothetical protein